MKSRIQLPSILAKEIHRLLFNPLVITIALVLILGIALSTIRSVDSYRWKLKEFEAVSAPIAEGPTANCYVSVAAEPKPLHILARGVSDIMVRPVLVMRQLEASLNMKYSIGQDRRQVELLHSIVPDIDPLMVLQYLFAILALIFSFDSICGERQSGTLKLALANSVPRRTLLTGKIVAGCLSLAAILAIAMLLFLAILWAVDIEIPGGQLWRLAAVFFAAYVYGIAFLAVGTLVSTSTRSAGISILVCLAVWCLLVIVAPGLIAQLSEAFSPIPPTQQVYTQKLAIERELKGGEVHWIEAETLKKMNKDALRAVSSVDQDFLNQVRGQESLARVIGLISPALAFDSIATTYAGTGIDEEHELIRQLYIFFRRLTEYDDIERTLMTRTKPDKLPEFRYIPLAADSLITGTLAQWAALLITILALFALAYWRLERYDVR